MLKSLLGIEHLEYYCPNPILKNMHGQNVNGMVFTVSKGTRRLSLPTSAYQVSVLHCG